MSFPLIGLMSAGMALSRLESGISRVAPGLFRYARWLHTGWPAGEVEKLPDVQPDGATNVPGVYVVGDLTGIPLLKFALDSGARTVKTLMADPGFQRARESAKNPAVLDLVIIGGGVSGMAAALEAQKSGLRFTVVEAAEPFATLVNFPRGKPIFTYPTEMTPAGELQLTADRRESLIDEARQQLSGRHIPQVRGNVERVVRHADWLEVMIPDGESLLAHRVIVAIGRSGNYRTLDVPGEDLDKVSNRLHDPKDCAGKSVLVVGGGDSALEAAVALAGAGANVTLSYRGRELTRPRPENVQQVQALARDSAPGNADTPRSSQQGRLTLKLETRVERIAPDAVVLKDQTGKAETLPNDAVYVLIGREAPLEFFRRSGIRLTGEQGMMGWVGMVAFLTFCIFLYNWKAGGALKKLFESEQWFPFNVPSFFAGMGGSLAAMAADKTTLLGTAAISLTEPGFYYSFAYTLLVVGFGFRRIGRRKTPYVTAQTLSLMAFQVIPLFLLPYFVLPYLGQQGLFDSGVLKTVADGLFPAADYGHGREYWRAFGLILAWPLFIWNVFTWQPMWGWLGISLVQTFVIIPAIVYVWGKGAYCGWICSCGALAETLGDAHRHKMPHGSKWNRLNMAGQGILAVAFLLLFARIVSWIQPDKWPGYLFGSFYNGLLSGWQVAGIQLNYYWVVDVTLAGIVGVGLYFWYSGRVWCRFFCPLAALMHIYARFSRFRILADKKKCISCNVCTSVCHQGIDVMRFAQQGLPMEDPECVRCSACVQSCPTGVLEFGQIDPKTGNVLRVDALPASPVRMREQKGIEV